MPFHYLVTLAGAGQLGLVLASAGFPRIFNWQAELASLPRLLRRLFWIYAAYILGCNLAFGLVSAFRPQWLLDGTPLATAVSGFVALYWSTRLILQFTAFSGCERPEGVRYRVGEAALVLLLAFLSFTYVGALTRNLLG